MLTQLDALLAQTPMERLTEASRTINNSESSNAWWISLPILLGAMMLLMVVAVLHSRRAQRERAEADRFATEASGAKLTSEEAEILRLLARLGGLRAPSAIFAMEEAFDLGVQALLKSDSVADANAQERADLSGTLGELRTKLGFLLVDDSKSPLMSSHEIPDGSCVTVWVDGEETTATVVGSDPRLALDLTDGLMFPDGTPLAVQYFDGASVWKFDATVAAGQGHQIQLDHCERMQFLNRRKFQRVTVTYEAQVANFPLQPATGSLSGPVFNEALVTELGGTGLRLETPAAGPMGPRVLVTMRAGEGQVLQAVANVIRSQPSADGQTQELAVELVALSPGDVALLGHLTLAAQAAAPATMQEANA